MVTVDNLFVLYHNGMSSIKKILCCTCSNR